jgi:hypothetical protein
MVEKIPGLPQLWLSSLYDFLADSEWTLETTSTYTVCIRRVHDRRTQRQGTSQMAKMQTINRCHLYLQVERLSNVCTADGLRTDTGLQAKPPNVTL